MSKFGWKRLAGEVRMANDVFEAVEIASELFSEKCKLVVVDNVWETV